ncbi:PP2C family serine/threonine-protein phosphatase [Quadrisphaera sp. INWT6]|uniref:PP2C family protein-serine/threonine phosphatase n=1 Tax=Quadrisphaera sp. INWT6 TaxID=2596917 RepID=UPI002106DF82|nr:protein phosphatase 2C domain-containing protein [Quadrisphaera sp. INWT6]
MSPELARTAAPSARTTRTPATPGAASPSSPTASGATQPGRSPRGWSSRRSSRSTTSPSRAAPKRSWAAPSHAQRALSDHATGHPATAGMATTLTALLVTDHDLVLAHVGDSRAYLRPAGGELRQVTRDDTYVQLLVDAGQITDAQAETHPMRHVITGCLGARDADDGDTAPALTRHPARAGDRWLLCSDGLSGVLSTETMQWVMDEEPASWPCAARLVELALRAGATDNVTAVVVDVVREGCVLPFPPRLVGAAAATWTGPDPYDDVI